jgi:hypothetical protein
VLAIRMRNDGLRRWRKLSRGPLTIKSGQSVLVSSSMVAEPAFFWIDAMVSNADVLRV